MNFTFIVPEDHDGQRLSDFIRDLDGYEKSLLENVNRNDLAPYASTENRAITPKPDCMPGIK